MSQAATSSSANPAAPFDAPSPAEATQSLGIAAARTLRRNRPSFLVTLGAIALMLALAYAVLGWVSYSDARKRAQTAERNASDILLAAARLKQLQDNDASGGSRSPEVASGGAVLSRIEGAGTRAGLVRPVPVGSTNRQRDRDVGWDKVNISYNVKDPSLEAILKWMELAIEDVQGLEVSQLTLRPEASEWSMTVVYARWEKPEGSP